MADPIYYTQIKQKIAQFEREKEQVLAHLDLVERRIKWLERALEAMEVDSKEIQQFDTEHFQYRVYRKQFNGKITQLIQKVMKAEPERYWRALELAEAVLIADKQPNTPISKYHTNNIGNAMTRLVNKGVVERIVVKEHKIIQWKWIQK
ncbi:hypothetical protein Q7306_08635 [Glaesserella parasuis]|uniref:DNA repair ATPase n=2 Tax=Pasteurellaceae TaxID=712 RepID=A0ABY6TJF2_9PAST|nr:MULTISPECIES: hypothetical protein [Pasteurellaceae]MCI7354001.1 hypothetical protein [[Actinobacillus] rossii]MDY5106233.1 hypothetical protein [Actinobacillus minor]AIK90341.1 hypothetical protein JT17_06255 [Glaesserella parasuis]ATW46403.1 hypothetical protein A2U21_10990 [Glaesserella parasuis str. Nagasaki]AWY46423.1 hypothetical protein B4U42_11025 [Glaesserella parasuis 29755]